MSREATAHTSSTTRRVPRVSLLSTVTSGDVNAPPSAANERSARKRTGADVGLVFEGDASAALKRVSSVGRTVLLGKRKRSERDHEATCASTSGASPATVNWNETRKVVKSVSETGAIDGRRRSTTAPASSTTIAPDCGVKERSADDKRVPTRDRSASACAATSSPLDFTHATAPRTARPHGRLAHRSARSVARDASFAESTSKRAQGHESTRRSALPGGAARPTSHSHEPPGATAARAASRSSRSASVMSVMFRL